MPDYMNEFDDNFEFKNKPDETTPKSAENLNIALKNIRLLKQYLIDLSTGKYPFQSIRVGHIEGKNLVNINDSGASGAGTTKSINGNTLTLTTNRTNGTCFLDIPIKYELNRTLVLSFNALYKQGGDNHTSFVYLTKSGSPNVGRIDLITKDKEGSYKISINNGLSVEGYLLRLYLTPVATNDVISIDFKNLQLEYDVQTEYSPFQSI